MTRRQFHHYSLYTIDHLARENKLLKSLLYLIGGSILLATLLRWTGAPEVSQASLYFLIAFGSLAGIVFDDHTERKRINEEYGIGTA